MAEEDYLMVLGGPLFRKPGTTKEEFSKAWHRHAKVVIPWFLEFGVTEYTQIHLPLASNSNPNPISTANSFEQQQIHDSNMAEAFEVLRQADGVAFVKCLPLRTTSGVERPFGNGFDHPYFSNVITKDERTFLHSESGASAVKGSATLPSIPDIVGGAMTWRKLALEIEGQEYVKTEGAKAVVDNVWREEWTNSAET